MTAMIAMTAATAMTDSYVLRPHPPFSFSQALAFLRRFPPTQGERVILEDAVLGAARVGSQTVGFRVTGAGDVEAPTLRCTLYPGQAPAGGLDAATGSDVNGLDGATRLDPATVEATLGRIGDWLGIGDDLAPFYALAEADLPFQAVLRRLYGYHQVRFFTPFENTCWAILGQRTPFAAARAAKRQLMEQCGGAVEVDGHTILGFPEPDEISGVGRQDLAALVGSERKADRLLAIAQAFAGAGAATLGAMPTEDLGEWLRALPGIGPWSVSFILLRGFGRVEAPIPLGTTAAFDRELVQAGRTVYGSDLTPARLAEIARGYGSQWGSWAHYLRVAA